MTFNETPRLSLAPLSQFMIRRCTPRLSVNRHGTPAGPCQCHCFFGLGFRAQGLGARVYVEVPCDNVCLGQDNPFLQPCYLLLSVFFALLMCFRSCRYGLQRDGFNLDHLTGNYANFPSVTPRYKEESAACARSHHAAGPHVLLLFF